MSGPTTSIRLTAAGVCSLNSKFDDPGVFTMPWTATVTYLRSIHTEWEERVCAENVEHYYTLTRYYSDRSAHIPTALKPDF